MKQPTIILADDDTSIRQMLAITLRMDKYDIVAQAADGESALKFCRRLKPQVLVADLRLPVVDAVVLAMRLREQKPPVPVVIFTDCEEDRFLAAALEAKPAAMIHKTDDLDDLRTGVREALRGGTFLSPRIGRIHLMMKTGDTERPLTDKETELVRLIATGHTNKKAADLLGVSRKTVEHRRESAMRKLGVRELSGLMREAIRLGLVSTE